MTKKLNKIQLLNSILRLSLSGMIPFAVSGFLSFESYNNYWDRTIFRVQTVDFNILSHTLPAKLSYAITQNQTEEVQRTLDSNYSLFGLVVTDYSGQKIIAFSGKNSNRSSSWKAALNLQELKNHPYDLLLDPPPLFSQWTYRNPHATERKATNLTNKGRVIGRVYYVRGIRPTFQGEISKWLSNPLSDSGNFETYKMTLLACLASTLAIWRFWEYLIYKKRVVMTIAETREQELKDNNRILKIQLAGRINELTSLQNQRELEKNELTNYARSLRTLNTRLEQEISQLKESLNSLSEKPENLAPLQAELEKAKLEAETNSNKQKQYQQHIQQLNQQLQLAQQEQLQQQVQEIENSRLLAESELEKIRNNEINFKKNITDLERQLDNKMLEEKRLNNQIEILQNSLLESQQREEQLKERTEQIQVESQALAKEIIRVQEDIGRHPLNVFERCILNLLQRHFPDRKVYEQFDVNNGSGGSMFTDFIIVMDNCCIVIEAKSYTGIIKALGYPRNTGWICITGNKTENINACWGKNPYEQVWTYSVSLYGRIKSPNQHKLPVYGIVVFPENSTIDDEIQSNISDYYRITTIDNLTTAIQQLESQARFKNKTKLTYQQILQRLTGIFDQQAA